MENEKETTQIRLHIDNDVRKEMKLTSLQHNYNSIIQYDLDCLLLGHKIKTEELKSNQKVS